MKKGSTRIGATKICPMCHIEKSREEGFGIPPSLPWGYPYCKDCRKTKEGYRAKAAEQKRESALRRNYGLDLSDYKVYWQKQEGRCGLCEKEFPLDGKGTNRLWVDHDHETGQVRGLLCAGCNKSLGTVEAVGLDLIKEYLNAR